jgi:thiol-disulfide isomerase/thioredoxin
MRPAAILLAILAVATAGRAQTNSVPLDTWKNVLLTGDAGSLRSLYSVKPAPRLVIPGGQTTVDDDLAFWTGLKINTIDFETLLTGEPRPGLEQTIFTAKLTTSSMQALYVSVTQVWQRQPEGWRLVAAERTAATHLEKPTKEIYPPDADAHAEIKQALAQAAKNHKRVLLVFGASWCYDCHVLDLAFHRDDLAPVVEKNYEVVHVDIGEGDKNKDLVKQYEIPMEKGIPAIAVLASDGKLLYSQKNGEFEKARALDPETLLAFLNKWKPS